LDKKGGKACPVDVRAKIDAATFYLWRAIELRAYIVADARKRGTPINPDDPANFLPSMINTT
jgi:hypothetical protein